MGLMDIIRRPVAKAELERTAAALSLDDWIGLANSFTYNNVNYTMPMSTQESIGGTYASLGQSAYRLNGIVFAVMAVRSNLFAEARFLYRRTRGGSPGDLFDFKDSDLDILRNPWPGATTVDLLTTMILHADLAGNAFVVRRGNKLTVLRPDWVTIIGGVPGNVDASVWHPDAEVLAYAYHEGGPGSGKDPMLFDVSEVAHFAPVKDPFAKFRGMSWLTPVVREIMADKQMTEHKLVTFEQGATPNLIVKMDVEDLDRFKNIISEFRAQHEGSENAGKTMFLAAGADATVVGQNFTELSFKETQGAGETRIAAAGGVPPVIVGLSEGLAAATYSNYELAMRRFNDLTMSKLWRDVCGSLAQIVKVPSDAELWVDGRDIPALKEDKLKAAEIRMSDAQTIKALVDAGFESDSVVKAVDANDLSLLAHTGLFSVQLQPAGTTPKQGLMAGTPVPEPAAPKREYDPLEMLDKARSEWERDERQINVNVTTPDVQVDVHPAAVTVEPAQITMPEQRWEEGAIQVHVGAAPAPDVNVSFEPAQITVEPAQITVEPARFDEGAISVNVEAAPAPDVHVTVEAAEPSRVEFAEGAIRVDAPPPAEVSVNIEPAQITVEPTVFHEGALAVRVEPQMQQPDVVVNVAAPNVTVEPAAVTVENIIEAPNKKIKIQRGKDGLIQSAKIEDDPNG